MCVSIASSTCGPLVVPEMTIRELRRDAREGVDDHGHEPGRDRLPGATQERGQPGGESSEEIRARDEKPRTRLPLSEVAFAGRWGRPAFPDSAGA